MNTGSEIGQLNDHEYEALLEPIWKYLAVDEEPEKSEVIFVFGGLDIAVPARAAELFLERWAPKVLVTGSAGKFTKDVFTDSEAVVFKNEMVRAGVPAESIIVEQRATNTQENVQFGMEALGRHNTVPRKTLLVGKSFLMRRCIATFAKHFPYVEVRSCPPRGSMIQFIDRPRAEFAERLIAELQRLRDYAQKGFIVPQKIPADVDSSAERLTRFLHM